MKKPTPSYPIILLLTSIISISFTLSGYGQIQKASSTPYTSKDAGKFIKQWSLLGPISINKDTSVVIDAATQEKFFNDAPYPANTNDQTPITINGDSFQWQAYSASGQLINLDSLYKKDNAIAYAFADISADAAKQAFLAIGSDDGVKVWHNSKLVHKNWTPRGLTPDQDLIAIPLVQGSNKIVIAVQDINGGWGFTARFLDAQGLSDRLINESARGNLDDINLLIDAGADPNKKNSAGISSLNAAKLAGRTDAVKLLTEKGAKDEPMPDAELLMDNLYGGIHKRKTAPAVAVLVSKDGKVLYKKAYGYADRFARAHRHGVAGHRLRRALSRAEHHAEPDDRRADPPHGEGRRCGQHRQFRHTGIRRDQPRRGRPPRRILQSDAPQPGAGDEDDRILKAPT